ncbi:MAG: penicillin-binding protein activator [Deltaproteobacteria bacterium]|nr:MAG: penicillin-binding protein activator [Deltaproteobacteria bacterium]
MKKGFLLVLCLVVLGWAGCSSMGPKTTQSRSWPKTPEMIKAFESAEKSYSNRSFLEAESLYRSYLKDFSFNALTPKAYFRLGELRLRDKDFASALVLYRKSTENYIDSEWGSNSLYKQAVCSSKLEHWSQVFTTLDQITWQTSSPAGTPNHDIFDGKIGVRVGSLRVAAGRALNDVLQEYKGYLELIDSYDVIDPSEAKVGELNWIVSQNTARQELDDWIKKDSLSPESDAKTLEKWLPRFEGKISGGYVYWKLARLGFQRGDYTDSAQKTRRYLSLYPRHLYREEAQNLLIDLEKRGAFASNTQNTNEANTLDASLMSGSSANTIGVLLPLSGKYAVYGESVLHGLECAGGIFSPCHGEEGVQLIIRDTKGDPQLAAAYMGEFANNSNIRAVIGPLPQVEIEAAAQAAERHQIPMISLSQKAGVADLGDYVFRNFLTAEDQVMTLVDYACHTEHLKKFAILYPEGAVGDEYQKCLKKLWLLVVEK